MLSECSEFGIQNVRTRWFDALNLELNALNMEFEHVARTEVHIACLGFRDRNEHRFLGTLHIYLLDKHNL